MRLWIVEGMANGSRVVVYAEDASDALAGVSDNDRALATRVREWPPTAPFRIAFMPATPADEDGSTRTCFWDGVTDWGEHPPPATSEALGDPGEAALARDQHQAHLRAEHDAGGHEPATIEDCPMCFSAMIEEAVARRDAGRRRSFDA